MKLAKSVIGGALLCLLVLAFACGSSEEGTAPDEAEVSESQQKRSPADTDASLNAQEFIFSGWDFEVGETRPQVVENLGEPRETAVEEVENRHIPGQIDEIHTLTYDGLSLRIYDISKSEKSLLIYLSVSSDRFAVKGDLGVGTSRGRVVEILGQPDVQEEKEFVYQDKQGLGTATVHFYFEDDRVTRIEWDHPPD